MDHPVSLLFFRKGYISLDHVTSQLETDDLPNANRDIVLYPASDEDLTDEVSE